MSSHQERDQVADLVGDLVTILLCVVVAALLLPLAAPAAAVVSAGPIAATRTRYWIVPRRWVARSIGGVAAVVALLTVEGALVANWFQTQPEPWAFQQWSHAWPWLMVNAAAGVLLIPAALSVRRRLLARQIVSRRLADVLLQEQIEAARLRAAAWEASRRMGVQVDARTGQITGTDGALTAPLEIAGRYAFGFVATPTITTFRERYADRRRVRDWIEPTSRTVVLPEHASAARALVIAESGTGKTVLLNGLVGCALKAHWPVFVIDAKGDPADADDVVRAARAAGRSAAVGARWNLFSGTADQVTEKLMRLLPPADGANQHYLDEARGVLGMVQALSPIRSVNDLRDRLEKPSGHLRDAADQHAVEVVVDSRTGQTAGGRVLQALMPALRPLEEWIDAAGWSFAHADTDVTVMSLSPVDVTQARLGHLLMVDLRQFLATRLRAGDKSPVLVVVDEFPQLVTVESDPGDAAAALLETARSAGAGLVLALQSTAGLSNDDTRRARALASGAALILGRSKDPETAVRYAGSVVRLESSADVAGDQLGASRAQHSWVISPQAVREAWDGSFWLVQGGGVAAFRSLPVARPQYDPTSGSVTLLRPEPVERSAPAEEAAGSPPRPITILRPLRKNARFVPPAHRVTPFAEATGVALPARDSVVGLEVVLTEGAPGEWDAVAYPATADEVLDDVEDPDRTSFAVSPRLTHLPKRSWVDEWAPDGFVGWGHPTHRLPKEWTRSLDGLVERARHRYGL